MDIQRWTVGDCTITSVLEEEMARLPPEMFFPQATAAGVARHPWLVPDFADAKGRITLRVQAFVVEVAGRTIVVDPCVGNLKTLELDFWNGRTWPFLDNFVAAGFVPEKVDTVIHTHLHADHVGWDTRLDGDRWMPTFVNARHLYNESGLAWCKAGGNPGIDHVYEQSIAPIIDAGLADVIAEDADLGDGLRLEPTPGHTPGHVSLIIDSRGASAIITGDFMHHPVQCAEPQWAEAGDEDPELALATRRRMLERASTSGTLFLGTHFPTRPAGRVVADGDVWRFVPEP
jgi:glyoxylase-like metal-dependent hydrolase (beta-lactamase superfamily II)